MKLKALEGEGQAIGSRKLVIIMFFILLLLLIVINLFVKMHPQKLAKYLFTLVLLIAPIEMLFDFLSKVLINVDIK